MQNLSKCGYCEEVTNYMYCSERCHDAHKRQLKQAERFEKYIAGEHWNDNVKLGEGTLPKRESKLGNGKFSVVEKPEHYHTYEMDTLTFLEKGFPSSVLEGFLIGNVIKYTQRAKLKNGQEDLEKAKFYSKRLAEFNQTMVE